MGKKKQTLSRIISLRDVAVDPLRGIAHEVLPIAQWPGHEVIVRRPSLSDRLFHLAALRKVTGVTEGDSKADVERKLAGASDHQYSAAAMVVRVMFEVVDGMPRRVFADADLDLVAAAFDEPHARIFAKAIELGNLGAGAVKKAKKPSVKSQTSDSG